MATIQELKTAENKARLYWITGVAIGVIGLVGSFELAPCLAVAIVPGYLVFVNGSDWNRQAKDTFTKLNKLHSHARL